MNIVLLVNACAGVKICAYEYFLLFGFKSFWHLLACALSKKTLRRASLKEFHFRASLRAADLPDIAWYLPFIWTRSCWQNRRKAFSGLFTVFFSDCRSPTVCCLDSANSTNTWRAMATFLYNVWNCVCYLLFFMSNGFTSVIRIFLYIKQVDS